MFCDDKCCSSLVIKGESPSPPFMCVPDVDMEPDRLAWRHLRAVRGPGGLLCWFCSPNPSHAASQQHAARCLFSTHNRTCGTADSRAARIHRAPLQLCNRGACVDEGTDKSSAFGSGSRRGFTRIPNRSVATFLLSNIHV